MGHYQFFLATGNEHKREEFQKIFDPSLITLRPLPAAPPSVEETGETFFDNALIKARAYYDLFKGPVMSDDSGLVVEALPGELGVRSARFGGAGLSDRDRCQLLLEKLKEKKDSEDRKAYFVCVLCFYFGPKEIFFFEGRLSGQIGFDLKGEQGFGYDPLFLPEGLKGESEGNSLAQAAEWKKTHSHRGQACYFAQKFLQERICQNSKNT